MEGSIYTDLFTSLSLSEHSLHTTDQVLKWVRQRRHATRVEINKIAIQDLDEQWSYHPESGDLFHESGRFFEIKGLSARSKNREWQQPIIHQKEIGISGIICKKINGVLHFLLQAKIEPGNINLIQLSPTLQATKSNYEKAHHGKAPLYLEHFLEPSSSTVLIDSLQTEQCSRYYQKCNRHILILVADADAEDDFIWLTLGQNQTAPAIR